MKFPVLLLLSFVFLVACGKPDFDDPETLNKILDKALFTHQTVSVGNHPSGSPQLRRVNSESLYSGWVKSMYDYSRVASHTQYHQGTKDGLEIKWHRNGQRSRETIYSRGKLDGKDTHWNQNGQKTWEINYKNGRRHGRSSSWDNEGELIKETKWKHDKEVK